MLFVRVTVKPAARQIHLGKSSILLFSYARQMKLLRLIGLFLSLTRGVSAFAAEEPAENEETIYIEAIKPGAVQWEYEKTGIITITDEFLARYKDATLTAKRGAFDTKTGDMTAEGAVNLQYENQVWR